MSSTIVSVVARRLGEGRGKPHQEILAIRGLHVPTSLTLRPTQYHGKNQAERQGGRCQGVHDEIIGHKKTTVFTGRFPQALHPERSVVGVAMSVENPNSYRTQESSPVNLAVERRQIRAHLPRHRSTMRRTSLTSHTSQSSRSSGSTRRLPKSCLVHWEGESGAMRRALKTTNRCIDWIIS